MNNIFIVIGRITKDLELRYTKESKPVTDVNIATNNGKDDTTFIKVTLWNKTAETTAKYCKKGDLIAVSGIIKNHNWEDEKGNKHYDYMFMANKVSFLSSKKEKSEEENTTTNTQDDLIENDPFAEYGENVKIDDNFLN